MTERFPWLPSMNVGIRSVDDDHRRMLALMTVLVGHVESANVAEAHDTAIAFLAEMDKHFASEEALMRKHSYPEADDHFARHTASRELAFLILEYTKEHDTICRAGILLQELSGNFFRNLLQEDGVLAEWLLMRGIREWTYSERD